jgi:hypothetical protein
MHQGNCFGKHPTWLNCVPRCACSVQPVWLLLLKQTSQGGVTYSPLHHSVLCLRIHSSVIAQLCEQKSLWKQKIAQARCSGS